VTVLAVPVLGMLRTGEPRELLGVIEVLNKRAAPLTMTPIAICYASWPTK
jgi:hypothetical protein